jgi:hypothetical protein
MGVRPAAEWLEVFASAPTVREALMDEAETMAVNGELNSDLGEWAGAEVSVIAGSLAA